MRFVRPTLLPAIPLIILVAFVLISVFAPQFAPYDPIAAKNGAELQPPSVTHLLGTDLIGRDVLSRLLYGGRRTLLMAGLALLFSALPGLMIGVFAGWIGGEVDRWIGAILDAFLALPPLLISLVLITLLGRGDWQVGLAVGFSSLPAFARVIRASVRQAKVQPFIEAARSLGGGEWRLVRLHLLPTIAPMILSACTLTLSWAILNGATLNFLGLGGDPGNPEWGAMMAEGRQAYRLAILPVLAPAIAILLVLLAVNWIADSSGEG